MDNDDKFKSGIFPIVYKDKDFQIIRETTQKGNRIYTIYNINKDEMACDVYKNYEEALEAIKVAK